MPPPGFEDTPDGVPGGAHPQNLRPLTNDLIAAVLAGRDYTVYTDADGDLVGKWDDNLIYFFRLGDDGELLQVRTMAGTTFSIDDVPALYAFCNAWNHDRLWPKAFVHVNDDGSARVCGEVIADLAEGVTLPQLDQLVNCGISTGCQMAAAVAELRA
jgi:hypothetical protein